jgi:hypothetical protein
MIPLINHDSQGSVEQWGRDEIDPDSSINPIRIFPPSPQIRSAFHICSSWRGRRCRGPEPDTSDTKKKWSRTGLWWFMVKNAGLKHFITKHFVWRLMMINIQSNNTSMIYSDIYRCHGQVTCDEKGLWPSPRLYGSYTLSHIIHCEGFSVLTPTRPDKNPWDIGAKVHTWMEHIECKVKFFISSIDWCSSNLHQHC